MYAEVCKLFIVCKFLHAYTTIYKFFKRALKILFIAYLQIELMKF